MCFVFVVDFHYSQSATRMTCEGAWSGLLEAAIMRTLQHLILLVLFGVVGSGCQTFSLTHEEWVQQQQGQRVDPEVAPAVEAVGSLGALGVIIAAVAGAFK
jgi:hypothetical protein